MVNISNPLVWVVVIGVVTALVEVSFRLGWVLSGMSARQSELLRLFDDLRDTVSKNRSEALKQESPVQLTEFGEQIARHIGAEQWARLHVQKNMSWYRGRLPYEIDQRARDYVNTNPKEVQTMIAMATYQFATDPFTVRAVLAVVLRNEALKNVG